MTSSSSSDATSNLKLDYVIKTVQSDCLAADLQVSFFVSALQSYRHDTILRPFPPQYKLNDDYDYSSLKEGVLKLDSLSKIRENWTADADVISLLHWILTVGTCRIKTSNSIYKDIVALTKQSIESPEPRYIFEVCYSESTEEKFRSMCAGREIFYACHGSKVENFHSIVHFGLQGHMNKNALYGEGTYLSSELSVTMPYASTGLGFKRSLLGERLSCIAVCEIIDDPESVKCQTKESIHSGKKRNRIRGSIGGDVPEKYYIVRNNDMCRVKYLLVYSDVKTSPLDGSMQNTRSRSNFVMRHKMAAAIALYGVMLLFLGLYNSKYFNYLLKKWLKSK